ncbi:MAG: acetyl-CoA hydrolase/transferase C-terminal domain-containing protein [Flavobacteriaceae bacterium]|nr:acetyl-CoA hydrolase/transferase C-terminal domain-containing protein [Flavobacteriaceae bacterium]
MYCSAEEALSLIKSNDRIYLQGSACTPNYLANELAKRNGELENVEVICMNVQGDIEIAKPGYEKSFYINALFVSAPVRENINSGRGSFVPIFLSDIPDLFRNKRMPLDVAIIHVSEPDQHGNCSLGLSVDITRAAVDSAKYIIAQVNPQMPRTHGDGVIHISQIDKMVWHDTELMTVDYASKVEEEEWQIGRNIAEIIDDRSTLQMGVGTIPDAVLKCLNNHKDLGIHTEMLSDGVIDLIKNGVVNNKYKKIHQNKNVTSFCFGTRKLYDFVDDNPAFIFLDVDYTNDPRVIRRNPKMVAINSAVEIDLTGQICSDSIGSYHYSGIGGQVDFMRGAALSEGGKAIIAVTSRTKKGVPRITPFLKEGAGVVTTRGHIHYVATEYGIVDLHGKNFQQRAKALISIAHPDDREMLEKAAFERFKI